jgi:phosphatidylglycerol:prolipoprotein diacylglycerol transferase
MVFPNAESTDTPSLRVYNALRDTVCAGLDPTRCVPRFPSQLYQAVLEGLVLFVVMILLSRQEALRARFGLLTGVFLAGYAAARIIGECFREPDAFLGFLAFGTTMGQILSIPMLIAGIWLILRAARPAEAPLEDL